MINNTQKIKLFELFEDEMMDDTEFRGGGPFEFKIYSNPTSKNIVIRCYKEDYLKIFYVIDYVKQEPRPDCIGTNGDEDKFFLNCEIELRPKIFYELNEELTSDFNNRYNTN